MHIPQFSIRRLMGVVLFASVGLAALRLANETWAGVTFLVTCSVLALAVVGAACRREEKRAWWIGLDFSDGDIWSCRSGLGRRYPGCRPCNCSRACA